MSSGVRGQVSSQWELCHSEPLGGSPSAAETSAGSVDVDEEEVSLAGVGEGSGVPSVVGEPGTDCREALNPSELPRSEFGLSSVSHA